VHKKLDFASLSSAQRNKPKVLEDRISSILMDKVIELIDVLNSEEKAEIRASAALELGEIGDMRALDPLLYHLKNSDEKFVRRDCAEALGILEATEAVDALVDCMFNDPFRYARNEAAEALGKIADPETIPHLLRFMQEEEWDLEEQVQLLRSRISETKK